MNFYLFYYYLFSFASLAKINYFIPVLVLNFETNESMMSFGEECYYFQTDCDQGCLEISRLLKWDKELLEMSKKKDFIEQNNSLFNEPSRLEKFVKKLGSAKNVIVMTGAGISTNAGIPDFRSKSAGLYNTINMPDPTDVFSLNYFKNNPEPFYEKIFDLFPLVTNAKPTITHYFSK